MTGASLRRAGTSPLLRDYPMASLIHRSRGESIRHKREALTISCPGRGAAPLRRCAAGPGPKIAKTTPCKVEWDRPGSPGAALRRGTRRKRFVVTNLISSCSRRRGRLSLRPTSRKRAGASADPTRSARRSGEAVSSENSQSSFRGAQRASYDVRLHIREPITTTGHLIRDSSFAAVTRAAFPGTMARHVALLLRC